MTRRFPTVLMIAACVMLGANPSAAADSIEFDFLGTTPVGSWQEREQVTTEGGKQIVSVSRIKYLGDEERSGEAFAWIETETSQFMVKKGNRKAFGKPTVVKMLMKKSILDTNIANALSNFHDLAVEVIMQSGDSQPMRIKGAGSMMAGVAQMTGLQIEYSFERDGSESVSVPAGSFDCDRYRGSGSTTMKVVIKTITVESTSTQWLSHEVPFGVVKMISDDVINGKPSHSETTLTSFGTSGATSKIVGEPQDMEMPDLGGILGG